jgi:unsaturated rhamnogalacturonyl hydrolase
MVKLSERRNGHVQCGAGAQPTLDRAASWSQQYSESKMKAARFLASILTVAILSPAPLFASELPLSQRAADAAITRWPEGRFTPAGAPWAWNYELGTLLEGMESVWLDTADARYYRYIQASVDQLVTADGTIPTLKVEDYELDNILLGRQLLMLYGVTRDARYYKAATLIYGQLQHQPRNASGGFWHKQRYPDQMWLDGFYMAEPFYAEYAKTFHHPEAFAGIAHQFELMDAHARDAKTGLLYHGWDESKKERWADAKTGLSSQFWARAMGWYMMALVDTLDSFPENDPGRKVLLMQLQRDAAAAVRFQDPATGLWWQVMNQEGAKGNFLEASASCMFVYALQKGVRRGYLRAEYSAAANRGYKGIVSRFVQTGPDEGVSLTGTVKAAGLGGDPYRDGSYAYYIGEKVVTNDPKGVGAFLLASSEMENAENVGVGRGKKVLLDAWYNSQARPDASGQNVLFHYKWDEWSEQGFSLLGHIFRNYGAETETLSTAPTQDALRGSEVYILVSPDIPSTNPNPNYMNAADAAEIAAWVKGGGELVIFENDAGNADLTHMNLLAEKFGIHFDDKLAKHVLEHHYEMGEVKIAGGGPIFQNPHTAYMKDTCTIDVTGPAKAQLRDGDDVLMATARYGKGTVLAVVDPWFYNEYTDGRKLPPLPPGYDNFATAKDLARWIVSQARSGTSAAAMNAER